MSAPAKTDMPPRWLKPAATLLLIGTIVLIGVMLALLLAGVANARPLGTLIVDKVDPITLKAIAHHRLYQDIHYSVHCPCTLELNAREASGSPDAQFGLWLRSAEEARTVIAINSDGYYAIFNSATDADETDIVEWQRFTWLLVDGKANTLRVDIDDQGQVTVRLNDEVAAHFTWAAKSPIRLGFYARGGTSEASILVERLRIWATQP